MLQTDALIQIQVAVILLEAITYGQHFTPRGLVPASMSRLIIHHRLTETINYLEECWMDTVVLYCGCVARQKQEMADRKPSM